MKSTLKIDGIYCRQCGHQITEGYSYKGYCAVCAEREVEQDAGQSFLSGLRDLVQPGQKQ